MVYLTPKQLTALQKMEQTGSAALKRHIGNKLVEATVASRQFSPIANKWIDGPDGTKMYELTRQGRRYLDTLGGQPTPRGDEI